MNGMQIDGVSALLVSVSALICCSTFTPTVQ